MHSFMPQKCGQSDHAPAPAPAPAPPAPASASVSTQWKRIVIDSRTRDTGAYNSPSAYEVQFPDDINKVKSVRLVVADVPFASYLIGPGPSGSIPLKFGNNSAVAQLPVGDYVSPSDMIASLSASLQAAAKASAGGSAPVFGAAYIPRSDKFAIMSSSPFSIPFASNLPPVGMTSWVTPINSPARVLGFSAGSNYESVSSNMATSGYGVAVSSWASDSPVGAWSNQTVSYSSKYAEFSNLTSTFASSATALQSNAASWSSYDSNLSLSWASSLSNFSTATTAFVSSAMSFATYTAAFAFTSESYVSASNNPNTYLMNVLNSAAESSITSSVGMWIPTASNAWMQGLTAGGLNVTDVLSSVETALSTSLNASSYDWATFSSQSSNIAATALTWTDSVVTSWLPEAKSLLTAASSANIPYVLVSNFATLATDSFVDPLLAASILPNVVIAPFRRDFRSDRYVILKITPNAELLTSVSQPINRTFAIIPRGSAGDLNVNNNTQADAYEKRWNPPIERIAKMNISFTDAYGNPYDFQNQDHRLEFLFECVGHMKPT